MILIYSELHFSYNSIKYDDISPYTYILHLIYLFSFQMSVEMFDYMDDILNLQHAGMQEIDCYQI